MVTAIPRRRLTAQSTRRGGRLSGGSGQDRGPGGRGEVYPSTMSLTAAPAPLAPFHPLVRDWFARAFAEPTVAQERGWPPIAAGDNTLILAPTGSGKTLA